LFNLEIEKNIVLIGMPGVGKSTIGVILAKVMSRNFLDTDIYIQSREGRTLQEIINKQGIKSFCEIEKNTVLSVSCKNCVIATGGSVVYSNKAINSLKQFGILFHLYLPLSHLKKRLKNISSRGVVMLHSQSLEQLFDERLPLYERYADTIIDCTDKNHEEVINEILFKLKNFSS